MLDKLFTSHVVLKEEDKSSDVNADTRKAVLALITSNMFRLGNTDSSKDIRSILLLNTALSMLNAADDNNLVAIQAARRLAQMAVVSKKGK